jgi:antitoxin HicB
MTVKPKRSLSSTGSSKRLVGRPHLKSNLRKVAGGKLSKGSERKGSEVAVYDGGDFTSLDEFLADEGILEEVTARAIKRVIALQLKQAMIDRQLSKVAVADRMGTSRRQLDRVLDDQAHDAISIETLARAANAVGKKLKVELV